MLQSTRCAPFMYVCVCMPVCAYMCVRVCAYACGCMHACVHVCCPCCVTDSVFSVHPFVTSHSWDSSDSLLHSCDLRSGILVISKSVLPTSMPLSRSELASYWMLPPACPPAPWKARFYNWIPSGGRHTQLVSQVETLDSIRFNFLLAFCLFHVFYQ